MGSRAVPARRNIASLVGGVAIGVGCLILWLLVASELTGHTFSLPVLGGGIAVALAIGVWTRLADL
jgi:hypothetical protein